ncbi:hypothetical protein [Dokdonella soli]|uniref:Glycosyltransferase RgtA/B/C/D-like domain-containing protein n=1 Tax=Dokdonella soli TaxID=529810 RepID=A0ABP3TPV0_9GAMM
MFVAIVSGAILRGYQLRAQMLLDDEWHSVRMLIRVDGDGIAGHFGLADYCIPLTLYYRWLYDHAALSEWSMHLPLLLAGIALLLVAPWLLRRVVSLPTRAVWTGLLAISPTLIYFSRTARPYALVALLGFVAITAFRNWQARRGYRRAWAALYVAATFVAGWMHLLSLVFTLWPFAYYGIGALRGVLRNSSRATAWRSLLAMVGLGVATVVPLAIVLAPPLLNDWGAMAAKAGANSATAQSLYRTLLMQFGIADAWLCMLLFALLAFGVWRMWQRDRDLVALTLSATAVGLLVICAARPAWIQHAPVLVRYAAPILPFLLLYVAEGFIGVLERVRPQVAGTALASLGIGALFMAGPLPGWYYTPNQFMDHEIFQFDYDVRTNPYATLLQLGPVSPFYLDLAKKPPGSVTVIETPARAQSNLVPDPWYQKIHRQNVKFALASPVCGVGDWDEYPYTATGARFRRMVKLADILDGATYGADYLVMRQQPWTLPPGKDYPFPVEWPDMVACTANVTAKLGLPVWRDEQIVVFALRAPVRLLRE